MMTTVHGVVCVYNSVVIRVDGINQNITTSKRLRRSHQSKKRTERTGTIHLMKTASIGWFTFHIIYVKEMFKIIITVNRRSGQAASVVLSFEINLHGRTLHGRTLHGRTLHGRTPHGRTLHGRTPHGRTLNLRTLA